MDELLDLAYCVSSQTICGEGNVSMREEGDTFLIKASGTTLDTLDYEDLVRCDLDGNPLSDEEKKPSMEVAFHAWFYRTFPDINFNFMIYPQTSLYL